MNRIGKTVMMGPVPAPKAAGGHAMPESFHAMLSRIDRDGRLLRLSKEVDARHLSALVVKAERPVLFERVRGFDIPVVGGLFWNRDRLAASLGWPEGELGTRFAAGVRNMIEPVLVDDGPAREVVSTGAEVDLTELPLPLLAEKDGGPYISAGVVLAKSADRGLNAGCYRLMFRTRDETGIDLVTVSDLRRIYEGALARREPLPISVSVGVHPIEILSAAFKAPPGVSEMTIAGGLHGAPVRLSPGVTIDVPALADAEIVLEGELLPIGWTEDEGPFGEFAGMYGDLKANPVFKITAITRRRDAVFQLLQMPWENAWLGAAATEAQVWNVLKTAGVDVAAGRRHRGQRLPLVGDRLHPQARGRRQERADGDPRAARHQARDRRGRGHRHLGSHAGGVGAHVPGAGGQGRHRDQQRAGQARRPQRARVGAREGPAAHDGEDGHRRHHPRGDPAHVLRADPPRLGRRRELGGLSVSDVAAVAARMEQLLREHPRTFYALVRELGDAEYRVILQAWGSLREARRLGRDEHGLYQLRRT